jgi:hypothetical protein
MLLLLAAKVRSKLCCLLAPPSRRQQDLHACACAHGCTHARTHSHRSTGYRLRPASRWPYCTSDGNEAPLRQRTMMKKRTGGGRQVSGAVVTWSAHALRSELGMGRFSKALRLLLRYTSAIVDAPGDEQRRKISRHDEMFARHLGQAQSTEALMRAAGWQRCLGKEAAGTEFEYADDTDGAVARRVLAALRRVQANHDQVSHTRLQSVYVPPSVHAAILVDILIDMLTLTAGAVAPGGRGTGGQCVFISRRQCRDTQAGRHSQR